MSTQVQVYDQATFSKQIETALNARLTLVDFSAEARCAPCRALAPALDKLAEEFSGRIDIVKINVDEQQALAAKYRIKGIPTLKVFRQGEVLDSRIGAQSYSSLVNFVKALLENQDDNLDQLQVQPAAR